MDEHAVKRYLQRVSADRPDRATADSLRMLHVAHLLAVPFENLSIHLGEPISLDEASLVDKLIDRNRGGFCYELNGAFGALLSALGFDVTLLAARVFGDDGLGPLFDHLVLRVAAPEPWLVDVGFGEHSLHPLRLEADVSQIDPRGTFVVTDAPHGDVDVAKDGQPQYRIELRERVLEDFEPMCWWHQTSAKSHFTRSLMCSLPTATGRVTLSDRRLIRTQGNQRVEETIDRDDDLLAVYRTEFGIVLDRPPHLADGER